MKNSEIEVGGRYTAKVSDKLTTVAIRAARPGGGWDAVNLTTGKAVVIKSAQRLRKRVSGGDDEHKPVHVGKVTRADGKRVTVTVPPSDRKAEAATDAPAPEAKRKNTKQDHETPSAKEVANDAHNEAFAKSEKKTPNAKRDADPKKKRVSLLDAAAVVLKDAKAPLQAKQIVERVIERGLWTPGAGKTPHATLYAAMTREIATKGKDARFRKVDRGQFASGGAAGKGA